MKKKFLKFSPVIIIFLVWFIFACPYFLQNKVPFPSSYQVNNFAPWSANSKFWSPVKNAAMPDVITQIYPWRYLAIEIWKTGQIPLWNPYTFSGNPLLANYQSAVLSPLNILFFILPFIDAWSILVLLQPLLAGLFMYLFVRSLKISRAGSSISSIAFMFCGFIVSWMGYATLGYAILFLPLSLYIIEKYLKTKNNIYGSLLSVTIPLAFFSGHFQISLYFLISVLAYAIYKSIVGRNLIIFLRLMFFVFLGVFLVMPQVLPSIELYLESFRKSFFQAGGIEMGYLPSLIAPDFFGNPVTRNNWFGHYAEWNAYVGLLPLMLSVYAILNIKNHRIIFFCILGLSSFLFAINTPISAFIQSLHFPILSTSSINRIIVVFSFSFAILAGFGYDKLLYNVKNSNKRTIWILLGIFSLLFTVLWIAIFQKIYIPLDKVAISRQNLILPTGYFLTISLLIVALIVFSKTKYNKIAYAILSFGFISLTAFDLLRFAIKWQAFDPRSLVFPNFSTTKALRNLSGYDRIFGNWEGNVAMYYKLPSVEGYDALYSKRYGQFIAYIEKEDFIESNWSVVSFPKNSNNTLKALNFLNIKYIVHKLSDNGAPWTIPVWSYSKNDFNLTYRDKFYEFYQNNNVFPHVFLVGKYRVIKDERQILKTMLDSNFDLRREVILEDGLNMDMKKEDMGTAKIISYEPNSMEISVSSVGNALLFLSDNYSKGWKASVDGEKTEILRADYAFRAIPVNKGIHNVRFWYDPWSFRLGVYFAMVGLIGVILVPLISRNIARVATFSSLQSEKDK